MRKTLLNARRVVGDLDLGLDNTRIETTALSTTGKGLARLITPGGRLPGQTAQGIYEESATQKYRIGTRMVVDERTFRYSKATTALIKMRGAYNGNGWPINAAQLTAVTIATSTIKVVEATAAAGDYAGGYIVLFTSPFQMRRILGNDVSDGTETILYVDGAWEAGAAIGIWATGYPSLYGNCKNASLIGAPARDYITFVVVPLIEVTINYFFWGQTAGPCYGTVESLVPGAVINSRRVNFSVNGHLWSGTNLSPGGALGSQHAGYLLPVTSSGNGDQFYMLELEQS